jgi:hypothetical protein
MEWQVEMTPEAEQWIKGLDADERAAIGSAIDLLAQDGPMTRRPAVGEIKGSKHDPKMKELRSFGGHLRMLFIFDPRRAAILLVGGDKQGKWNKWYRTAVAQADRLYDTHLADLKKKGMI